MRKSVIILFLLFCVNIAASSIFKTSLYSGSLWLSLLLLLALYSVVFVTLTYQRVTNSTYLFLVIYLCISAVYAESIYGFNKLILGLLVPVLCATIIPKKTLQRIKEADVINVLIFFGIVVAIQALLYKLNYGFSSRQINYGLFGPITFGWIMGMTIVAILFSEIKQNVKPLLIAVLILLVVWSGSKGPLIAVLILLTINLKLLIRFNSLNIVILTAVLFSVGYYLFINYTEFRSINSMVALLTDTDEYVEGVGSGSVGSRLFFYDASFRTFVDNPLFGVGLGNWNESILTSHRYPHNIFLEILSETGIIGTALLISVIIRIRSFKSINNIFLFGLIAMMFSGDISYFRYVFMPAYVGYLIRQNY